MSNTFQVDMIATETNMAIFDVGHGCLHVDNIDRQRASGSAKIGYDFANGIHLFADVLYSRKESFSEVAPTPIAGAWLDTFFGRPYVPADHPNNPWGADGEIWYRVLDSGPRQTDKTSDQYRVTLGLEGGIGEWTWNASVLDSANRVRAARPNSILLPAFQDAVLAAFDDR